jgi:putative ABC transport system substrate-binding protein
MSHTVRCLLLGAAIGTASLSPTAGADQPPIVARIGVLTPLGGTSAEAGLREGLSELGYIEGRNLTIEWRRYEQSSDAMRSAAADLVRSRVDLIVVVGTQAARAALSATSTIPVVFLSGDPIGAGLAASLAHPGANATGISSQSTDLIAKRLQLLQQIAPRTRHFIMLMNPDSPMYAAILRGTQNAARTLHIHVGTLNAGNTDELDAALRGIQRNAGYALIVSSDAFFIGNKDRIGDAVRRAKLPTLVPTKDYWGEGVLMSYGPSLNWASRSAAAYVDKILKGAKPGDLPIEQGSKLELIIDLRVARELGLKVSQELLFRADEVIR